MIWTIARRNLREHRSKTLIIGTLVTLGVAVLIIGNSALESVTEGLAASYAENYTGDLIVYGETDDPVGFIGGPPPPAMDAFVDIQGYAQNLAGVEATTPLLTGSASLSQGGGALSFAFLWGIQPSSYFTMFPERFALSAGEPLQDGEAGIMLSQTVVDEVAKEHDIRLRVGDSVILTGQNDVTGVRIREVPIRGIGAYENAAGPLAYLSLVDASTLRALSGLTAVDSGSGEAGADVPADSSQPASRDEGDLFGDDLFGSSEDATGGASAAVDFDNILGDTSVRDKFLALDNNAWHFLLLNVADGSANEVRAQLAGFGADGEGGGLEVQNWRWAAGLIAELAFGLRITLNLVLSVITVVVVLIIVNTLLISVIERVGEIGTIRAIGAQKGFVHRMITAEGLFITGLFGLLGAALGVLGVGLLNVLGIGASNVFLQILFGGPVLELTLSLSALVLSLIGVVVIGVLASLYPTSVALGVSPVQAMRKA